MQSLSSDGGCARAQPKPRDCSRVRCGRAGADAVFDDCANCTYTQHTARRGLNKVRGTWQTMQKTQTQTQTFITDQPRRKPSRKLGRPRRMADSAKCCKLRAASRATKTTTKASQFFCTKHEKISWQLQGTGLGLRLGDWETETATGMGTVVCLAAPLA